MDTTIYLVMILSIILMIFINEATCAKGLEFVNPVWLYQKYKVNLVGAGLLTILFNVLVLPFAIGYWIYKICTVGRKYK